MILHKKVDREIDEVTSVVCDKCGKEYGPNDFETQEFHHIRFTGGYASVFGDETKVECDLCQHCLHEMIGDISRKEEKNITSG